MGGLDRVEEILTKALLFLNSLINIKADNFFISKN